LRVELDEERAEALPEGAKPAAEQVQREQPEDAHDR